MTFFQDKVKLVNAFHKWAEEKNKEIKGGAIDESDPIAFLTFLEDTGRFAPETREDELHEPKIMRGTSNYQYDGYVEKKYEIMVECSVCGRGLSGQVITDTSAEKRATTDGFVLAQVPNYCPHCGARLKEVKDD